MNQRLDYIDIARGLGILAVIYSHSGGEGELMAYIGGFFIPLFFILSGFTLNIHPGQSLITFVIKKGQRLLLPYLFFSAVLLSIYQMFSATDFLGVLYSRYCLYPLYAAENLFFLRGGNAPLWFLTSMFTAFLAVWYLMKSGKYQPYVVIAYLILTYGLDHLPILMPWSIDTAFLMAVFIWIGTKLKSANISRLHFWQWLLFMVAYLALCTLNGTPNLSVRIYARSVLLILMTGTIGALLVIKLSQLLEQSIFKGMLVELGRHSLVVFCVQMLLLRVQNQVLFGMLNVPLNDYSLYATSILKTVVAAIVGTCISKGLRRLMPGLF